MDSYFKLSDTKSQVLAAGVAILFGYAVNFVSLTLVYILGKEELQKRLRDNVSRYMYIFGIAGMLSVAPLPGLHGVFHAVLAWLNVVGVVLLHAVYFIELEDPEGKKRGIVNVIFWLLSIVWYFGIFIVFCRDSASNM